MSDNLKLGHLIDGNQQRDAIHIAIAPVVAAEVLHPGDRIGFVDPANPEMVRRHGIHIGIVDPFLIRRIVPGQRFWMLLFPGTITSLRHDWTHPAFSEVSHDRGFAEQWLRVYAVRISTYDTPEVAFSNLIEGLRSGEISAHGSDLHSLDDLKDADDLKRYAEDYLGISIDWGKFSFGCSC